MISDITLGQFFPGQSFLHKLDPRSKIILATLFIVAIFLVNNPLAFVLLSVFVVFCVFVSRISLHVILKGIKPLIFIMIFASVLNLFMTTGDGDPLFAFGVVHIYKEGIIRAIFMTLRVIVLIIGTSVFLTYTTSPIALTDGLESLLSPLRILHIPVHIFSMMMSIALRFIPTLVEETEKIMNAQKSRGADFTSGNIVKRAKALIPILVPLFVSSFKRAEELATAMECRCYRVDKERTKMKRRTLLVCDYVSILVGLLLLAIVVILRVLPQHFATDNVMYQVLFFGL